MKEIIIVIGVLALLGAAFFFYCFVRVGKDSDKRMEELLQNSLKSNSPGNGAVEIKHS